MFRAIQLWIVRQQLLCLAPCQIDQPRVRDAAQVQIGQAALAGAQELTRPAQFQVFFRQHEAIVRGFHGLQAFAHFRGDRVRLQQAI